MYIYIYINIDIDIHSYKYKNIHRLQGLLERSHERRYQALIRCEDEGDGESRASIVQHMRILCQVRSLLLTHPLSLSPSHTPSPSPSLWFSLSLPLPIPLALSLSLPRYLAVSLSRSLDRSSPARVQSLCEQLIHPKTTVKPPIYL